MKKLNYNIPSLFKEGVGGGFNILLFLTLFFCLFGISLQAQNVVINEYYNGSTPAEEWTELLVVVDNTSLVGYTLRDNIGTNGIPNEWQGGVKFKDNLLWKNLSAGTIIVINHRGSSAADADKSDGYIQVDAENAVYFERRCFACNVTTDWAIRALSIAAQADIIEIIDESDRHIHSLSHIKIATGDYVNIIGPKINFEGECPIGSSVRVVPGFSISDYQSGSGTAQADTSSSYITKGEPNNSKKFINENMKFWLSLRQPNWQTPQLSAYIEPTYIKLSWNQAWNGVANDDNHGYLILRIPTNLVKGDEIPRNGLVYDPVNPPYDKIGNATVVANVNKLQTLKFDDYFDFKCGESYTYKIYAYKFALDNLEGTSVIPESARGRIYTTSFADITVRKTNPPKPSISSTNDKNIFCTGDSIQLNCNITSTNYHYDWKLDGSIIQGANKSAIYAKSSGFYSVVVTDSAGCYSESDSFQTSTIDIPKGKLFIGTQEVLKDTLITICNGEYLQLNAEGGTFIDWYDNGAKIASNMGTYNVVSSGIYSASVSFNKDLCKYFTKKIQVFVKEVNYVFDKDTLEYYLTLTQPFQDKTVTITNLSSDTLEFIDIIIPTKFTVSAPAPTKIILPNKSKTYTIRYTPSLPGNFFDVITFVTACGNNKKLYLKCYKEEPFLRASSYSVMFDSLLTCDTIGKIKIIKMTNRGTERLIINKPSVNVPFYLDSPAFPDTLEPNNSVDFEFRFYSKNVNFYNSNIKIPYIYGTTAPEPDTLNMALCGNVFKPEFEIGELELNFNELAGCEDSTVIKLYIKNPSRVKMTISEQPQLKDVRFLNIPMVLNSSESDSLEVCFVPQQDGTINGQIDIIAEPCSVTKTISVSGSKKGIFLLKDSIIHFGNIIQCLQPGEVKMSLQLIVIDTSHGDTKISNINNFKSLMFSHNLTKGQILTDTNIIEITFLSGAEGYYRDSLQITLEPCGIKKTIYVDGIRLLPSYKLDNQVIDFGYVQLYNTAKDTVKITNKGLIPIFIDSIEKTESPFYFAASNPAIPITLLPDSSVGLAFEYKPIALQKDNAELKLYISPCNNFLILFLSGEGIDKRVVEATVTFPSDLKANTGETVLLPMSVEWTMPVGLGIEEITKIETRLYFNPTLLYPFALQAGAAITNSSASDFSYSETSPGKVSVIYTPSTPPSFTNGEFFILNCRALLGNKLSTAICLDTIIVNTDIPCESNKKDGLFTLEGGCALDKRLIDLNGDVQFYLTGENPVKNKSKLIFETATDDIVSIALYNTLGFKCVDIVNEYKKAGNYCASFSVDELPEGFYFAVLRAGGVYRVLKIVVKR